MTRSWLSAQPGRALYFSLGEEGLAGCCFGRGAVGAVCKGASRESLLGSWKLLGSSSRGALPTLGIAPASSADVVDDVIVTIAAWVSSVRVTFFARVSGHFMWLFLQVLISTCRALLY
ncbi:unnamed protein product [Prorocentrum cordatum]|uniref:Uncharacterized protein n=1 Tax=Prorocentrum cordatum TaxID=2364126 RepID=A0ABN9RC92_9DINO|nr:unnamed protein product [Polarella glacialis]